MVPRRKGEKKNTTAFPDLAEEKRKDWGVGKESSLKGKSLLRKGGKAYSYLSKRVGGGELKGRPWGKKGGGENTSLFSISTTEEKASYYWE